MVTPLPLLTLLTLARVSLAAPLSPEPPAPPPPVGWVVDRAEVTVHLHEGEASGAAGTPAPGGSPGGSTDPTIDIAYTFRRVGTAWTTLRLADNVLPRTASGAIQSVNGAVYVTLDPALSTVSATVSGILVADAQDHALVHLPAAGRTVLHVDAPGLDVTASGSVGATGPGTGSGAPGKGLAVRLLPADGTLDLSWRPHVAPQPEVAGAAVVRAELSTAAWPQDGALMVRSRVRFVVTRGEASSFTVDTAGLEEVEVVGPVEHALAGTTLTLTPAAPVSGILTVEITGRRPAISGGFPVLTPQGVSRVETWYTLGKADEGDIVPSGGVTAAARQLPLWARGHSESTPVAYWSAPPSLTAGSFDTVMGPDTIVQSAEYVVSQSEDGHVLARATWLVRNERSQYLKVTPPKGYRPLTARVSGRPALLLREGDDFYVPLEKSIETVQGLLAFPVEVAWVGEDLGWSEDRHAARTLALPAVNAPIQSASWEVHLPRGWKLDAHQPGVSGGSRGPAPAEARVLDPAKEQAREAWTNAIDAYKKNDFGEAQRWLDASRGYADQTVAPDAATMDNVSRLQSNLDVLIPKAPTTTSEGDGRTSSADDVLARRVRDLANAKTTDAQLEQAHLEEDARKALLAGDDEKAAAALEKVTALAEDIGITVQKESTEQSDKVAEYEQTLNDAKDRVEKKKAKTVSSSNAFGGSKSGSFGGVGASGTGEGGGGVGQGQSGTIGGLVGGEISGAYGAALKGEMDGDGIADDRDWDEDREGVPAEAVTEQDWSGADSTTPAPSTKEAQDLGALGYVSDEPADKPVARTNRLSLEELAAEIDEEQAREPMGNVQMGERRETRAPAAERSRGSLGKKAEKGDEPTDDDMDFGPAPVAAAPPSTRAPSAQPAAPAPKPSPGPVAPPTVADGWTGAAPEAEEPAPADVVTGTFSTNFNHDAVDQNAPVQTETADAEQEESTVNGDFLARIPTGRSYQSAVSSVAGVVAPEPDVSVAERKPRSSTPVSQTSPYAPKEPPKAVSRPVAGKQSARADDVPAGGSPAYLGAVSPTWDGERYWGQNPPPPPPPPPPAHRLEYGAEPDRSAIERARSDRLRADAALQASLEQQKRALKIEHLQQQSRTKANGHNGPDTRERRNPLEVSASALTPALPLDGPTLTHTAALLQAGEIPSFDYTVSPDPSSVVYKE